MHRWPQMLGARLASKQLQKLMTRYLPSPLSRLGVRVSDKLQGLGWVASSTWAIQGIRLVTLAVLTNYLAPDTFGFFAFALAIFTIAQPIVGLGISGALVVAPKLEHDTIANGLLVASLAALLGMVLVGGGWIVSMALDPQLSQLPILGFMIPGLLLSNIANVTLAVPRREKQFRQLGFAMLAGEVGGSAVGIALAANGHGIDSLVWRYLAISLIMAAIGLWLVRRHLTMPRLRESGELLRLGLPVAGSETLVALRSRGDELVIGALFGAVVLGIYSIARRYIDALRAALPAVVGQHAWPVLASLRDHSAGFTRQLRRSLTLIGVFVWPIFVALAALAPLWVPTFLGSEWSPTIRVIQVLCLIAIVQSAVAIPVLAIVGLGFTAARLRLDIVLTIATFVAMALLASFGMRGLLGAMLAANVLVLPYQFHVVARHLPVHLREVMPVLAFPLAANVLLAAVLITLVGAGTTFLGEWPTMAIGTALAGLVPLAALLQRWAERR